MTKCALLLILPVLCRAQFVSIGGNGQPGYTSGPVLIQQTTCSYTTGSNFTCTLGSTPSALDVLILTGGLGGFTSGNEEFTVSSTGATWVNKGVSLVYAKIWCATLSGTPGTTITIGVPGGQTNASANISEWSNQTCTGDMSAGGGNYANNSGSSSTVSTASLTTALPDLAVVSYQILTTTSAYVSGPTSGFTALNTPNNALFGAAYQIVPNIGSYSTTWTITSGVSWQSSLKILEQ